MGDFGIREVCQGCKEEIDPEVCWCGSPVEEHSLRDNHAPLPMGCRCLFDKDPLPEAARDVRYA